MIPRYNLTGCKKDKSRMYPNCSCSRQEVHWKSERQRKLRTYLKKKGKNTKKLTLIHVNLPLSPHFLWKPSTKLKAWSEKKKLKNSSIQTYLTKNIVIQKQCVNRVSKLSLQYIFKHIKRSYQFTGSFAWATIVKFSGTAKKIIYGVKSKAYINCHRQDKEKRNMAHNELTSQHDRSRQTLGSINILILQRYKSWMILSFFFTVITLFCIVIR